MNEKTCPCGSQKSFQSCCAPYLKGEAQPKTAEALMRARYTAFAKADVAYIVETHWPAKRSEVSEPDVKRWAESSEWKGLKIVNTVKGQEGDTTGQVEFIAHYRQQDTDVEHHENAEFKVQNGKWYFVDGKMVGPEPLKREGDKIGRNDPCSCGSGKKYKKCCG